MDPLYFSYQLSIGYPDNLEFSFVSLRSFSNYNTYSESYLKIDFRMYVYVALLT
jgi:hypothetical protein